MTRWIDYWKAVGARITWDASLLRGVWIVPFLQISAWLQRRRKRGTIAFHPQPAGPWYTISLALAGSGLRRTRDLRRADAVMVFDDRARSAVDLPREAKEPGVHLINARATDITKAHVGRVFEASFGYPLSLDPTTHRGPMVEKSDDNGVHDGRIVHGPLKAPRPGCVYQVLADSMVRPGVTEDLRCTCVGGEIVQVFRKEKATSDRFAARYLGTTLHEADEYLSAYERRRIASFCQAMGLDFGSIDVLRDHAGSGRIYVVDVNKTCMPVLSMPAKDLRLALARIGRATETLILGPAGEAQPVPTELEGAGLVAGQVEQL